MTAALTIQIVGWNSADVLPATLQSLQKIPRGEAVIRYIDNASLDNSIALVREHIPHAEVLALSENFGFAGAHNKGFARCTTPFVLTLDPDLSLIWPGLKQLLAAFTDESIAAVQGKLYRAGTENIIDSAGIVLTRALNGKERGANEEDRGQYNTRASLIAVTGACGLYRLNALKAVAHRGNEIFDRDFFAYKEDVDLGWRLCNAGYKVRYVPVLVGYHRRTLGKRGTGNWGLNPIAIYRRLQSPRTRYSLRNWLWMIIKNASPTQIALHAPFIGARKLIFLFFTLLYPPLLSAWFEVLRSLISKRLKTSRTYQRN